jgi:hypothetical protein
VEVFSAAESLKRRIKSELNPLFNNNTQAQKDLVAKIMQNPTQFIPRRNTTIDNNLVMKTLNLLNGDNKSKETRTNKYSLMVPNNVSNLLTVKKDTDDSQNSFTQTKNKHNSVFISSDNINLYKFVTNKTPDNKDNTNEYFSQKRRSTNYNKLDTIKEVPEINVNLLKNIIAQKKIVEYIPKSSTDKDGYYYSFSQISSVFYHLKYLNKFPMPEEFKNEFNLAYMSETPKDSLEQFKGNIEKIGRTRAKTLLNNVPVFRSKYIIF